MVIAHRGALHEALENSMSAFERAIDAGAARIELDAQLTADGHVVVMHDDDLRRTTGHHARISELSSDALRNLRLSNNESIPFLVDVLASFITKIEFNIEIKGDSIHLAAQVCQILKNLNRDDQIVVSCFQKEPLLYLREHRPGVRLACLVGDLPRWPNISERQPLIFMNTVGTNIIHPWTPLVDSHFMDQAKARNWLVYPYCSVVGDEDIDREALWTRLMTLGVDGLCTNYPRELNAWLGEVNRHAALIKDSQ